MEGEMESSSLPTQPASDARNVWESRMVLLAQRQGLCGSRPVRRPQEEKAGGRPGIPGLTMIVPTHPLLAEIVGQIVDWDVPDGDVAQVLAPKALPSTAPVSWRNIGCRCGRIDISVRAVIGTGG